MKTVNVKIGSTLNIVGRVALPTGTWTISSKVKRINNAAVQTLTSTISVIVSPTDAATHAITLSASATETAAWPVGNLLCDIRFADSVSDKVIYSPTFAIVTEQAVTNV